ncbi:MAG: DUF4349 domain-containing protein [Candidatus Viridilinea halotolerans]|uniref:DUF4349 domain-containing protein n=1 Tax=Candidatus Viridilinea halotolerans TaxID=2491704 RepID=A0A426U7C9_9CHLR|nr:MAG: DUF4349 domain-containing protein [Candidatus Viridilinea halotolerans]
MIGLTLLGGQVAEEFSDISFGLDGVGGSASAPQALPQADNAALETRAQGSSAPGEVAPSQRIVIKQAHITVQVPNVSEAEAILRTRAEQLGGFVVGVQTTGSDAAMASTITFRVRAEHFDEALSGIEGLAQRVISRNVSGEDVTEEFFDISARLRNLEQTRDRLAELLARADTVEDALQVTQALSDIQGEIERFQGRIKYLQENAALSTITAELRPVPAIAPIIDEDSWQPLIVARNALSSLIGFFQSLVNVGIVLLVWLPIWLPLLLLGRWLWRHYGQRA